MKRFVFKRVDYHDAEMMNQIYRLRFQVYCRECGFIKEEGHPDGMEKDEYDPQSLHFVAINYFKEVVGSMRLILPGLYRLPVFLKCRGVEREKQKYNGDKYGEVSRLVISKMLKRKKSYIKHFHLPIFHQENKVVKDFMKYSDPIALGLYREMYSESMKRGIKVWYTLMEQSLWQLLLKHGFDCTCVGEEVDFHGPVKPYVVKLKEHNGKVHV